METTLSDKEQLLLPAPSDSSRSETQITVSAESVKLDRLGPMVVNSDGVSVK